MYKNRKNQIDSILADLEHIRGTSNKYSDYAVDQLVTFFNAARSMTTFVPWVIFNAPKIDHHNILEINDFPFPQYEKEMHERLIEAERKQFPGLIELQVVAVSSYILSQNKDVCIMSLGSGGMEVERQIFERLIKAGHKHKVTIVGDDYSESAHHVARNNLSKQQLVDIVDVDQLNDDVLSEIITKSRQFSAVLCKNDIFALDQVFPEKRFDAVIHTLFRHHLSPFEYSKITAVIKNICMRCFEYDGYKSWVAMIPQTVMGWKSPIFLNAEIFSSLRFMEKSEVQKNNLGKLTFTPIGYYLLEVQY
jgi:hypothetical protein